MKASEFTTSPSSMVLNESDRALAERLLAQRKKVARTYALIVGAAGGIFVINRIFSIMNGSPSNRLAHVGLIVVMVALLSFMLYYFGFRLVMRMQEDLKAGLKYRRTSVLRELEHHDNAHGETITWIWLDGDPEKLLARGPLFVAYKAGDKVTLEFLPRSRLVFHVKKADS